MNDYLGKDDKEKPKLQDIPPQILLEIAKAKDFGTEKYGDSESWKDVEIQRYYNAFLRHTVAWWGCPQGLDEESGLSHLSHMCCNLAFICALEEKNKKK